MIGNNHLRRANYAALGFAVTLTAASQAAAKAVVGQAGEPNPLISLFSWLSSLFGNNLASLILLIVLPSFGYVLKGAFEEWKAANAKRRDFVAKTSDKVVGLAWDHYWGLANATGTLSSLLTNHLRQVDAHLLVVWDSPQTLRDRMDEISKESARDSFASFFRLLHAFERFQFRGSNTYLLPDHAAGEALQRLYNRFIMSLGDELFPLLPHIRLAIERKTSQRDKDGREPPPDLGSAQFEMVPWKSMLAGERDDAELDLLIKPARKKYEDWLIMQPAAVADAADALHAFSRLLTHELANLHAVWHRDRGPFAVREAWRQARGSVTAYSWPGVLDDITVVTLLSTRDVPPFFTPLGRGLNPPPFRRKRVKKVTTTDQPAQPQDASKPSNSEQPAEVTAQFAELEKGA